MRTFSETFHLFCTSGLFSDYSQLKLGAIIRRKDADKCPPCTKFRMWLLSLKLWTELRREWLTVKSLIFLYWQQKVIIFTSKKLRSAAALLECVNQHLWHCALSVCLKYQQVFQVRALQLQITVRKQVLSIACQKASRGIKKSLVSLFFSGP